jgi:hypothetical protein
MRGIVVTGGISRNDGHALGLHPSLKAGLPDGLISNQNPNLGKFWRALDWKTLWPCVMFHGRFGYFMIVWYILCSFGRFFPGFGIMYQEKSGNPDTKHLLTCAN